MIVELTNTLILIKYFSGIGIDKIFPPFDYVFIRRNMISQIEAIFIWINYKFRIIIIIFKSNFILSVYSGFSPSSFLTMVLDIWMSKDGVVLSKFMVGK